MRALHDRDFLIQTIAGHRGTITGLVCAGEALLSSSVDGTIRMWKCAASRQMAYYPWFEPHVSGSSVYRQYIYILIIIASSLII